MHEYILLDIHDNQVQNTFDHPVKLNGVNEQQKINYHLGVYMTLELTAVASTQLTFSRPQTAQLPLSLITSLDTFVEVLVHTSYGAHVHFACFAITIHLAVRLPLCPSVRPFIHPCVHNQLTIKMQIDSNNSVR